MAKTIQDLVEKYKGYKNVYKNKEVFNPNWSPEKLEMIRHRDEQIKKFIKTILDFIHYGVKVNRFLLGPNSTGKSLTINYWKNNLSEVLENGEGVEYIIIPCGSVNSWLDMASTLTIKLNIEVKRKNSPTEYFKNIFEKMDDEKKYIFVFDEIDKLSKNTRSKVVTVFSRPSEITENYPNFLIIIAGNDISTIEELDWDRRDRTHTSSFNPNIIDFPTYTFDEIKDIIKVRFEEGLNEGLYSEEIIVKCSSKIKKNLNSDIRLGLKAIELAISKFQDSPLNKLEEHHIDKGIYKATETSIRSKLNVINNKHAILLCKILTDKEGYAKGEDLIKKYKEEVGGYDLSERAKASIYNYLNKLSDYSIIKAYKSGNRNENEYRFKNPYNSEIVRKAIKKAGYLQGEF